MSRAKPCEEIRRGLGLGRAEADERLFSAFSRGCRIDDVGLVRMRDVRTQGAQGNAEEGGRNHNKSRGSGSWHPVNGLDDV